MHSNVTIRLTRKLYSESIIGETAGLDPIPFPSQNQLMSKSTEPSKSAEHPKIVQFPEQNSGKKASPPKTQDDDKEPLSTQALIGIGLLLIVIVAGGVWLMNTLRDISKMQDCAMQGRRNCAPIEVPRDR